MNILFYCNEYPPYKTGGIGSVTKIVAEALSLRGHNIYVVGYYPNNVSLPEYSEVNGVYVYRLNLKYRTGHVKSKLFRILLHLGLANSLLQKEVTFTENFINQLVIRNKIDVIEFSDYYDFNQLARHKLRFIKFNKPTVLRVHGSVTFINSLGKRVHKCCKENDQNHFNRCDYLLSVSHFAEEFVLKNFSTNHFKDIGVIYNPLESSFLKKQDLSTRNEILFIGKLVETKGCFTIVKAFNVVVKKHPSWSLKLVGRLVNVDYIKSLMLPETHDKVSFMGYCSREQVQLLIDDCAFACIPSFFETFGLVATEVMGRSRPIIFTNRTSGPEIIHDGVDGILVNPENTEEVADAMCRLIENVELRRTLAKNAYLKVVKDYSSDKIINQLENFYQCLLKDCC